MVTNIRQPQTDMLNDVKYDKKQVRTAVLGLFFGLWGPFIAALILLFLCTHGIIG